jgi:hypothetical protein
MFQSGGGLRAFHESRAQVPRLVTGRRVAHIDLSLGAVKDVFLAESLT